jgi:hypothetical protein
MNSVMLAVLEGAGAAQGEAEEQLVERSAEQAKLGVNLLLFAGSRSQILQQGNLNVSCHLSLVH